MGITSAVYNLLHWGTGGQGGQVSVIEPTMQWEPQEIHCPIMSVVRLTLS